MLQQLNAQAISNDMSELFFFNIKELVALWYYFRDTQYFYHCVFWAALVLLYLLFKVVKVLLFETNVSFVLITHRDINTKNICHILLFLIDKNSFNYLMHYQYQVLECHDVFLSDDKQMQFLSLKHQTGIDYMYEYIINKIIEHHADNVYIYIYDTHDRYIDTICAFFGEKDLMKRNTYVVDKHCVFYTRCYNKKIYFYLINDVLEDKQQTSILCMLQSLEKEYVALQKIYYYDHSQQHMHPQIVKYMVKIVKFVLQKLKFV